MAPPIPPAQLLFQGPGGEELFLECGGAEFPLDPGDGTPCVLWWTNQNGLTVGCIWSFVCLSQALGSPPEALSSPDLMEAGGWGWPLQTLRPELLWRVGVVLTSVGASFSGH